MTVAKTERKAG